MPLTPRWPRTVLTVLVSVQILAAVALATAGALLAVVSMGESGSNPWAELGIALGVVAALVGLALAGSLFGALRAHRRGSTPGTVGLVVVEVLLLVVALALTPSLGTLLAQPGLVLVVGAVIVLALYDTSRQTALSRTAR